MAVPENLPFAAILLPHCPFIGFDPISMNSEEIERVASLPSSHSSARVEKLRACNHPPKAVAECPVPLKKYDHQNV
jgi:hypothetical protein